MVALPEEQNKWDLMTSDKNLENLVIQEYPGELFEHQILKINSGNKKVYVFTNLDEDVLMGFLEKYGENHRYIIVGSAGQENEFEAYVPEGMNAVCQ